MTHPSSGILAIKIQLLTRKVNKIVWSSVNKSMSQTNKKKPKIRVMLIVKVSAWFPIFWTCCMYIFLSLPLFPCLFICF